MHDHFDFILANFKNLQSGLYSDLESEFPYLARVNYVTEEMKEKVYPQYSKEELLLQQVKDI